MGAAAVMSSDAGTGLVDLVAEFAADPLAFTVGAYQWGTGDLAASAGPREWQMQILGAIGEHLRGPKRFQPLKIAIASGNGIGKSALIAQALAWGMSTCDDTRAIITAGTGGQLETKTVPEVTRWFRRVVTAPWWDIRATSVRAAIPGHELSWRADFVTWNEDRPDAFQGLHNVGKRLMVIFDEASAIADVIWDATEGALTDEGTEIIWLAFGNPTKNSGRFRECFGSAAHRWITRQVDSRAIEGTNKAQIAKWIEDWGEDSDFVRVRVRGEFPRAGTTQFIPSDIVARCRRHIAIGFETAPKILAVDVARFGDDMTAMMLRQGRKASLVGAYRGIDTMQTADKAAELIDSEEPDVVVVDGDGIGAAVVDRLRQMGYGRSLVEFHGSPPADDSNAYFNRRAEIWGLMRDALREGMQIPDMPEMEQDLIGVEYGLSAKDQVQLERKEDMKRRGLSSPDRGDALAMTFAVRIAAARKRSPPEGRFVYPGQLAQSWMG